jgi:cytidylate kinase
MEERLQKILARAGFGSRRECEDLIRRGRVAVNGQVAQLGQKADPARETITVDGQPVQVERRYTYVALHKPRGVLSDEGDGTGRLPTARDLVSLPGRLFPVGRLDLRSEGLILLTDDGELAHRLTHPRYEHAKEYRVRVEGHPDEETLERWQRGVFLDGRRTAPAAVSVAGRKGKYTWPPGAAADPRPHRSAPTGQPKARRVARVVRCRGSGIAYSHRQENEESLKPSTITIDGPAASGKSTVGEALAERLGYLYFDTGVMYRAVTWAALQQGVELQDERAVTSLAERLHIDVVPPGVDDGRQYTVLADGVDVTWAIRRPEVDANVSLVSTYGGVRTALVRQQRRIAHGCCIVMVGRDIGSVVLPDADSKIYLDASVEERARRRWLENQARGQETEYESVLTMSGWCSC